MFNWTWPSKITEHVNINLYIKHSTIEVDRNNYNILFDSVLAYYTIYKLVK